LSLIHKYVVVLISGGMDRHFEGYTCAPIHTTTHRTFYLLKIILFEITLLFLNSWTNSFFLFHSSMISLFVLWIIYGTVLLFCTNQVWELQTRLRRSYWWSELAVTIYKILYICILPKIYIVISIIYIVLYFGCKFTICNLCWARPIS